MRLKSFAVNFVLIALLAAGLACNTIMGGGVVGSAQATADAVLTEAAATGTSVQETADAVENEFLDTPEPDATEEATAEGEATEEGSADATATSDNGLFGAAPDDVPVIDEGVENFFASAEIVSYFTTASMKDVVTFYKDGMESNGWELVPETSIETSDAVILNYDKSDRTAIVTISADPSSGKSVVLVTITNK